MCFPAAIYLAGFYSVQRLHSWIEILTENIVTPSRKPLQILCDVVFALFLRELKTRFGAFRLGIAWAFLEPMAMVLVLTAVRSFGNAGDVFGIPLPIFFMLAYVPYQLFASLMKMLAAAIWSNRSLFHYRQVRPIDALLARSLLETLISVAVMSLLLLLFWWYGLAVQVANPLLLIASFGCLTLLGAGIGTMICVAQVRVGDLKKLVPILTKPLFFISGLFFSLNEIPVHLHPYLLWNPILHAVELIRHAAYPAYPANSVSLSYVAACALVALFFGLALYRLDWKRMVAT